MGIRLREIKPRGVEDTSGYCVHLPPGGAFRAGARLSAVRRGRVDLAGVSVETVFPFGFVRARLDLPAPRTLVIWPALGYLTADLLQRGAAQTSAASPGRHQGGQDEFFGLRDYRTGDSPRWVHWRRSAGRPVPVVREMAHPVPETVLLVLDTDGRELNAGTWLFRERMLRFAATLIEHALSRGFSVALAIGTTDGALVLPPGGGLGARRRLLDALGELADPINVGINNVIAEIPATTIANTQILLVTPRPERLGTEAVAPLARNGRHLEVIGPRELDSVFADSPLLARAGADRPDQGGYHAGR